MVLITFILLSNTIFIYGLRKTNKTLTYVQKLFIFLSCIDILIACVPSSMYSVYILYGSSCFFLALTMGFGSMFLLADSAVLFTISLLRLYAIVSPLKRINYSFVTLFVIIGSLSSIAIAGEISYVYWTAVILADFEKVVHISGAGLLGLNILTILCICICFLVIKKKSRLIGNNTVLTFDRIQMRQHKKSTITLLIMALVMIGLMFIQVAIFIVLQKRLRSRLTNFEQYFYTLREADVTVLCNKINPGLNSVIYICRSKKLKTFYRKKLFQK